MSREALLRIACDDLGLELDDAQSHRDGLVSAILREQIGLALCAGPAVPHI